MILMWFAGHMAVVKDLLEAFPESAYERSSHGRRFVTFELHPAHV